MSTKFNEYKGLNLPKIGEEILEFWKNENIFEKSIAIREGAKPFVFFEGPPSANGLPGIHHVMARAVKDIFCRYKTQQGFQDLPCQYHISLYNVFEELTIQPLFF